MLVSATALALPLCANFVTRRLTSGQIELTPIWTVGALMLGLLAVRPLRKDWVEEA